MRESGSMIKRMVMAPTFIGMALNTLAIGRTISRRGMGSRRGQIIQLIRDSISLERSTVLENSNGATVTSIRGNSRITSYKGRESINGEMGEPM